MGPDHLPEGELPTEGKITERVPYGIVAAQHGWWFPEEEDLGWDKANINLLTENDMESCDPPWDLPT